MGRSTTANVDANAANNDAAFHSQLMPPLELELQKGVAPPIVWNAPV